MEKFKKEFKKYDKVVCLKKCDDLEINKIYTVNEVISIYTDNLIGDGDLNYYVTLKEISSMSLYRVDDFISIKEIRKRKLEEINEKLF